MDASVIVIRAAAPAREGEAIAQHGIRWREPGTYLPILRCALRYTVPVPDPEGTLVPMAWRPGGIVRLAQDMVGPELGQEIRRALSEALS